MGEVLCRVMERREIGNKGHMGGGGGGRWGGGGGLLFFFFFQAEDGIRDRFT